MEGNTFSGSGDYKMDVFGDHHSVSCVTFKFIIWIFM